MTDKFKQLSNGFYVSAQINAEDIVLLKSKGFDLIINNRPDHEEPGQPLAEHLAAAAEAVALSYIYIPVTAAGLSIEQLQAFSDASRDKAKVLGFCKSGMRSTIIRAMALARAGISADTLIEEARSGGYDISGQRAIFKSLAAK